MNRRTKKRLIIILVIMIVLVLAAFFSRDAIRGFIIEIVSPIGPGALPEEMIN